MGLIDFLKKMLVESVFGRAAFLLGLFLAAITIVFVTLKVDAWRAVGVPAYLVYVDESAANDTVKLRAIAGPYEPNWCNNSLPIIWLGDTVICSADEIAGAQIESFSTRARVFMTIHQIVNGLRFLIIPLSALMSFAFAIAASYGMRGVLNWVRLGSTGED